MGKKFGKLMKSVNAAVTEMSQEQIAALEANGSITINVEGVDALIEAVDVEIYSEDVPGWTVANEGALTVALDVEVTDELRQEGIAREIVKKIQTMRKESGLDIVDRINVSIAKNAVSDEAVNKFTEYISNQVLADSVQLVDAVEGEDVVELDDTKIGISVNKA
jgi:isoleucyl-tRNA synthetase